MNLNVLIIEDDLGISHVLTTLAEQQGHRVTAVVGVFELNPFVGLGKNGERVEVNLQQIDLTLSDHSVKQAPGSAKLNGFDFAATVSAAGVTCHAMSSIQPHNEEMMKKGATTGFEKWFVVFALQDGVVSFADLHSNIAVARVRMEEMRTRMMADKKATEERMSELMRSTAHHVK